MEANAFLAHKANMPAAVNVQIVLHHVRLATIKLTAFRVLLIITWSKIIALMSAH